MTIYNAIIYSVNTTLNIFAEHLLLWFSRALLVLRIALQYKHSWLNRPGKCFASKWFLIAAVDLCLNWKQMTQWYSWFSLLINWSSSSKVLIVLPKQERNFNEEINTHWPTSERRKRTVKYRDKHIFSKQNSGSLFSGQWVLMDALSSVIF